MRSRTLRLISGTLAWIAIIGAAFLVFQSEQHIARRRAAVRAFDLHAREATDALADVRASQEAYVAAGQGVGFWMPRVAATNSAILLTLVDLQALAASSAGKAALQEASASLAELGAVDRRAREYIKSDQPLMAGDVIFTEGGQTAAGAARQIESARLAEHQAVDAEEAAVRRTEATALAGAAAITALVIVLLIPGRTAAAQAIENAASQSPLADLSLKPQAPAVPFPTARAVSPILRSAADLCTELGRVSSAADLTPLLGRAAEMMDASGLMVWVGDARGGDLRPALAHGYSAQALARMPTVSRGSNNAAAAAYRTGTLQIVLSHPGSANGAVVAPLLSAEGCVGALSAEIQRGGEASESVQAIATLVAAQLAGIVAAAQPAEQRAAAGSS